jgi:hypothetical protein
MRRADFDPCYNLADPRALLLQCSNEHIEPQRAADKDLMIALRQGTACRAPTDDVGEVQAVSPGQKAHSHEWLCHE